MACLRFLYRRAVGAIAAAAMFAILGVNAVCSSSYRQGRPAGVSALGGSMSSASPAAARTMAAGSGETVDAEPAPSDDAGSVTVSCRDASMERYVGSALAPSPGWWKEFVNDQAQPRPRPAFPRVMAPRVAMQVHGMDSSSRVFRAYRQQWGRFKVCYEQALGKAAASPGSAGYSRSEGHWIARVRQERSRVCTVDVVESVVSEEMSACLIAGVRALSETGGEAGTLEIALTFHIP